VRRRRTIEITGRSRNQHREDVVALFEVGGTATGGDLAPDQRVDAIHRAAYPRQATNPLGADRDHRQQLARIAE